MSVLNINGSVGEGRFLGDYICDLAVFTPIINPLDIQRNKCEISDVDQIILVQMTDYLSNYWRTFVWRYILVRGGVKMLNDVGNSSFCGIRPA